MRATRNVRRVLALQRGGAASAERGCLFVRPLLVGASTGPPRRSRNVDWRGSFRIAGSRRHLGLQARKTNRLTRMGMVPAPTIVQTVHNKAWRLAKPGQNSLTSLEAFKRRRTNCSMSRASPAPPKLGQRQRREFRRPGFVRSEYRFQEISTGARKGLSKGRAPNCGEPDAGD